MQAAPPSDAPARATISRPTVRFMLSHPAHLIALGFGSGLARLRAGHGRHAVGLGGVPGHAALALAGRDRLGDPGGAADRLVGLHA